MLLTDLDEASLQRIFRQLQWSGTALARCNRRLFALFRQVRHQNTKSERPDRDDCPEIPKHTIWRLWGELHREDGPAVKFDCGDEMWYWRDCLHRADKPAITYTNGSCVYYNRNLLHREDGPARIIIAGPKAMIEYWYHGQQLPYDAWLLVANGEADVIDFL